MQRGKSYSRKAIFVLCLASFLMGSLFSSRTNWNPSSSSTSSSISGHNSEFQFPNNNYHKALTTDGRGCDHNPRVSMNNLSINFGDQ